MGNAGRTLIFIAVFSLTATRAWAVQEHGGLEAFYVHQIAHILFTVSMVLLLVVLRKPFAAKSTGWRGIRIAAVNFILWNVIAFVLHSSTTYLVPRYQYVEEGRMKITDAYSFVYYIGSFAENIFLAAAFLFMALGIKKLFAQMREAS